VLGELGFDLSRIVGVGGGEGLCGRPQPRAAIRLALDAPRIALQEVGNDRSVSDWQV
jgi:hypothetical protein